MGIPKPKTGNRVQIAPSILSADFANLQRDIMWAEMAGADLIHIDVMDGHFVPNITIGAPVVKDLRKTTALPLDAHLMITDPLKYIEDFARAGADVITVHIESEGDTRETLEKIKALGVRPAVSVKPKTPVENVFPYLDIVDMVLVMTVEPGFSGQSFMADMMPKVQKLSAEINRRQLDVDIQVDGGINADTVPVAICSGANILVAGNAVFGAEDLTAAIEAIRGNPACD